MSEVADTIADLTEAQYYALLARNDAGERLTREDLVSIAYFEIIKECRRLNVERGEKKLSDLGYVHAAVASCMGRAAADTIRLIFRCRELEDRIAAFETAQSTVRSLPRFRVKAPGVPA